MNAAKLIQEIHECGGFIKAKGNALDIKAPPGVITDAMKEALRQQKQAILHLISGNDAAHYQHHYHERAGIMEYDGELPRVQAEAAAFEDTVQQWIFDHPPTVDLKHCAHCGESVSKDKGYCAYGSMHLCYTGEASNCLQGYTESRRLEAVEALARMGITRRGND